MFFESISKILASPWVTSFVVVFTCYNFFYFFILGWNVHIHDIFKKPARGLDAYFIWVRGGYLLIWTCWCSCVTCEARSVLIEPLPVSTYHSWGGSVVLCFHPPTQSAEVVPLPFATLSSHMSVLFVPTWRHSASLILPCSVFITSLCYNSKRDLLKPHLQDNWNEGLGYLNISCLCAFSGIDLGCLMKILLSQGDLQGSSCLPVKPWRFCCYC